MFTIHNCLVISLAFMATATAAWGQDPPNRIIEQDRPGGAVIILENNRLRIEAPSQLLEADALPTPQQLRGVNIRNDVLELVKALDAEKFQARASATRQLIDLRVDDVQLFAIFEHEDISPEQRHRLLHIVRERLTNSPRGALGIRMDAGQRQGAAMPGQVQGNNQQPGVTILEVIPGMPAARVMQVGDRVTHINQVQIDTSEDLIDLVQTRRPGDKLMLTIQRPQRDDAGQIRQDEQGRPIEQKLDVEITLGTVEDLHDPRIPTAPSRLDIERRRIVAALEHRYAGEHRPIEVLRP